MVYPGGFSRLLLLSALLCAGSLLWGQQATAPLPSSPTQEQNIAQLKDNLNQLLSLSLDLQQRLQLRIASFSRLQQDYAAFAIRLTLLQKTLSDSETQLIAARSDLETMQKLLDKLSISLKQASQSLADYKAATEAAVKAVEMEKSVWKVAGITFGVAAVIEGAVLIFQAVRK